MSECCARTKDSCRRTVCYHLRAYAEPVKSDGKKTDSSKNKMLQLFYKFSDFLGIILGYVCGSKNAFSPQVIRFLLSWRPEK